MLTKMQLNKKLDQHKKVIGTFHFLNDAVSAGTHSYIEIDDEVIIT